MATRGEALTRSTAPDPDALPARPSLALLLREGFSAIRWKVKGGGLPSLAERHDGWGKPVLLIPGFFATDISMRALRKTLEACNYRAYGWGQGMNWGARAESFTRLLGRLELIQRETGQPVTLIGWSVGGVIAREMAKCRPEMVERVVSLGAPFSGDPRANRIWRFYELIARHKVDAPPIECTTEEKPPVPTIALWSRQDGIVAPACARGQPDERDAEIEVDASHIGLVSAPNALTAILWALDG